MKAGVERLMSDKMNYMAEQGNEITLVTYEQGDHPMAFPLNDNIQHIDLDTRFFSLKKYLYLQISFFLHFGDFSAPVTSKNISFAMCKRNLLHN